MNLKPRIERLEASQPGDELHAFGTVYTIQDREGNTRSQYAFYRPELGEGETIIAQDEVMLAQSEVSALIASISNTSRTL